MKEERPYLYFKYGDWMLRTRKYRRTYDQYDPVGHKWYKNVMWIDALIGVMPISKEDATLEIM